MTSPGVSGSVSTLVVRRASRSRASSAAAVVSTLLVDAGCIGMSAPCAHSCAPVIASVMRPVSTPRFGSATNGREGGGEPVGRRLRRGVGQRGDAGRGGRRGGLGFDGLGFAGGPAAGGEDGRLRRPLRRRSPAPQRRSTTCVDRRHRVGRMSLLGRRADGRARMEPPLGKRIARLWLTRVVTRRPLCPADMKEPRRWSSTSSSRSLRVRATSTRWTTRPAGSNSTATSTRRWAIPPTTGSSRTPSARTATRWTRWCCCRSRSSPAPSSRRAPSRCSR